MLEDGVLDKILWQRQLKGERVSFNSQSMGGKGGAESG